jgi:hypothetical protein
MLETPPKVKAHIRLQQAPNRLFNGDFRKVAQLLAAVRRTERDLEDHG